MEQLSPPTGPIFLLGLVQRTGTELARMLLEQHPDCALRWQEAPGNEDWLLHAAHLLEDYVDEASVRWKGSVPAEDRAALLRSLGAAVSAYLQPDGSVKRTVVKTPGVQNLELFPVLFPESRAIVMVRDGRDTTESAVRTFGWSYPGAMRRWAEGAATLRRALEQPEVAARVQVVRYESLAEDLEGTLPGVLCFCGLEVDRFDFAAAARTPVRGSSELAGAGDSVDWKPRERTSDFRSTGRWEAWSPYQHQLFELIAGAEQRALGYGAPESRSLPLAGAVHRALGTVEVLARRMGREAIDLRLPRRGP